MTETLDKLDEDFLFLLGLTQSFSHRLEDTPEHSKRCNAWLEKLCGDPVTGSHKKRIRNTYLSKLILCMQAAELKGVFKDPPPVGDLEDTFTKKEKVVEPPWVRSMMSEDATQTSATGVSGRTYLATKQFTNGGACAYLAVANGTKPKDWVDMEGDRYDFNKSLEERFENVGVEPSLGSFELDVCFPEDYNAMIAAAISAELHGDICPGQIGPLENSIIKYYNEIADTDPVRILEMLKLPKSEQRRLILMDLLKKMYGQN